MHLKGLFVFLFLVMLEFPIMAKVLLSKQTTLQRSDTARINTLIKTAQKKLRSDISLSDSLVREAFELSEKSGYVQGVANSLIILSYISSNKGASNDGFDLCRRAIKISEDLKDGKLISQSYNQLYLLYYQDGNYDSATLAAEKSLAVATEINFLNMMARGHQNFGILNSVKGNHTTAIEHFLESEKYYTELRDEFALAMLMGNIGVTFEEAGNYRKAIEYMRKQLSMCRRINNESLQGWSLVNIGAVHSQTNNPDSAFYYYNQSLEIAKRTNNHDLTITILDNLGSYYSAEKEYKKATQYLKSAYSLAEETGNDYNNVYLTGHLAENYLAAGNIDSARIYAEEQLKLALDDEFLYDQKLAYTTLSQIYAKQNKYDLAYETLTKRSAISDSLFNEEKSKQIEELRIAYETEKKDHQIDILREQKAIAEFRRNVYIIAGTAIAAVLLLLYFRQRAETKRNLRLLEKEQELEKMKERFFTNISHEFRTPLTLILGPIDILNSGVTDSRLKLQINILQRNANRLLSLINQLLDLAKLESGELKLNVAQQDIIPIVKGVAMAFNSLAETKEIKLGMNVDKDSLLMYFDQQKIESVLTNLMSNAFKFTPEGGQIEVGLSIKENGNEKGFCIISVKDTGVGIPQEDIPHVFNRFYQSKNGNEKYHEGTGVGLALTKELVELHGGSVEILSDENSGTEIKVNLPLGRIHLKDNQIHVLSEGEKSVKKIITSESVHEKPNVLSTEQSLPVILLIEDNADVMVYLKSILSNDYHLLEARDGEEGVSAAVQHIPDLIISDVMMPRKDGYEVAELLKKDEKTSHVPIILLTAKASIEDKIQGLLTMADDYLTKPFIPKELLVRVGNLIESRKKLREKFNRQLILKPNEISINSIDEVFLKKVATTIEEHIGDEQFSVERLGEEVGMSRSQLHRKLHALTNQSASQFITSFRLDRAMEMIRQNAGTISEIAYSVGFSSPSYFNRRFLQQFGCTPTEIKSKG